VTRRSEDVANASVFLLKSHQDLQRTAMPYREQQCPTENSNTLIPLSIHDGKKHATSIISRTR
jgi:hypothetical protein